MNAKHQTLLVQTCPLPLAGTPMLTLFTAAGALCLLLLTVDCNRPPLACPTTSTGIPPLSGQETDIRPAI